MDPCKHQFDRQCLRWLSNTWTWTHNISLTTTDPETLILARHASSQAAKLMSIVTALPPGATDRCPWNERRLPREMIIKLFVLHFTVMCAFAHLRRLRRESSWPLVYIVIIANPITGMALILLPLILLPFQAILCRGNRTALRDSACILLGSRSEDGNSKDSKTHEGPSLTWPKLSKDLAAKIIVQVALMTQCISSSWLFSRRVKHDSDALYDHSVLQLALLGLSASGMSIIHLICQPHYPSGAYLHNSSMRTSWLSYLRPLPKEYGNRYRKLVLGMMEVFLYWLYAAVILPLARKRGLMHQTPTFLTMREFCALLKDLKPALTLLPIVFGIMIFYLICRLPAQLEAKSRAIGWIAGHLLSRGSLSSYYLINIAIWFFLTPADGISQIGQLLGLPANHRILSNAVYDPKDSSIPVPDWDSIWTFGHVPASFPCPEAWKDPMADYFWWLA